MLNVEVKPDGTLTANALYMLESGTNVSKSAAGDVIEVELR